MYQTVTKLRRPVHVFYPAGEDQIVLRTELDWYTDLEPVAVSADRQRHEFVLEGNRPFLYFKTCIRRGGTIEWSTGPNVLLLLTTDDPRQVYPFFHSGTAGTFSPVLEIDSKILGRKHFLRAYLPPGYGENPLKRYPVLYMQDGRNLFFPEEAFLNQEWQVDESLGLLDNMNAADKCVVVGLFSHDRMGDYTKPGYERYARSIVEEVKPFVDREYRTLTDRLETGVMADHHIESVGQRTEPRRKRSPGLATHHDRVRDRAPYRGRSRRDGPKARKISREPPGDRALPADAAFLVGRNHDLEINHALQNHTEISNLMKG